MIHIVQGAETELRLRVASLAVRWPRPLFVTCELDSSRSWLGVRQILTQSVQWLGEQEVSRHLERHAVPARLILDHWEPESVAAAPVAESRLVARMESHLTHNWAVQRPLIEGWARILFDLTCARDFCIVVPYVNFLDWETLATLKALYSLGSGPMPKLVLGYEKNLEAETEDENGIKWRKRPEYVHQAVLDFLASSDSQFDEISETSSGPSSVECGPKALSHLFEGVETQAAVALEGDEELGSAEHLQVVQAMEACFRRYSFTAALRLGVDLFRRSPKIRGDLAARAHAVVALSAHNRQFQSEGNLVLGRFIARHLEAALAQETRPAIRCALLYRLAVTYSRRLGQMDVAEGWAEAAIEEAENLERTGLKYQESWARNIYAYIATRQKNAEKARELMRAAFEDVSVPSWVGETLSEKSAVDGDLALTRSLVAHNLAVAEIVTGNLQGYNEMLQTACRLESKIERSAKYWAQGLVSHCKQLNRPDLALPAAHDGRLAATRDNSASLRLLFTLQIADLEYRLGRAEVSAEYYLAAGALASKLRSLEDYPDLDLPTVYALEEAGNLDRAEEILASKLASRVELRPEIAIATLSRLAVFAARRGDVEEAERWASQATDLAARGAIRHLLVRTGYELGRAARFLGRTDEAADLLNWALDLTEKRSEPASVSQVDELMVLTELGRCSILTPTQAERSLGLLADSLASSSESWWFLPDALALWLPLCRDSAPGARLDGPSFGAPELQTLLLSGELRDDCRAVVQDVRKSFGHLLGSALVATEQGGHRKRSLAAGEGFRE